MIETALNPLTLLTPQRKITVISAILLPFNEDGAVDWDGFCAHVARTAQAGLAPAVNMDTGYVNLIDAATRQAVLERTRETLSGGAFVAGAFVGDNPGDSWKAAETFEQIALIEAQGGTPVIFQSYG